MSLVKVKKFAQITIPANIRKKAHIEEGDYVDIRYEDNVIVLVPKRVMDKNIDWAERFDKAVEDIRETSKKANISEVDIGHAVETVRKQVRH